MGLHEMSGDTYWIYHAQKGKGSFQNGLPIHVLEAETLSETMIAAGTS